MYYNTKCLVSFLCSLKDYRQTEIMEFSRVGVGWRLVLDVGQQNPRRAGRTDFWSEPPSKNKHFPLVHCWLLFKNLCFLIHLHTLWSEQYTMTCRHPSGKIMHELFLFIPLVHCLLWEHNAAFKLLKRPCYKKHPYDHFTWTEHINLWEVTNTCA